MKKLVLLLAILAVTAGFAQDPEAIIVKYDVAYGGNYLSGAITSLWPGCSASYYDGSTWSSFITGLTGGDWDMCIVAAINYTSTTAGDWTALVNWYTANAKLHFFDWATNYGYSTGLINAMGASSPVTMGFTSTHYVWDSGHDIVQGIDPWTLDMHGWGFGVYHERYNWSTASPVTGWTATETANQAGIMEAENGEGVITGLYEGFMGGGQEQALWENVLEFMWGGEPDIEPPFVNGMDPDDGEVDIPPDSTIVFHCVDLLSSIDLDTIDFTARDTSLSDDRAMRTGASISTAFDSTRSIAGDLDVDDTDKKDVICTFTPSDPLREGDTITNTVAAGLADVKGNEMAEDFVWTFDVEGAVTTTTWGNIKAEF
jgi:hypothetical protein